MKHKLYHKNPNILILRKSKLKVGIELSFTILFFVVWYGLLFRSEPANDTAFIWLFYLAPLMALKQIIDSIKLILSGEEYEFDKECKEIRLNYKRILSFDDVGRIQIRKIYDSDGPDSYNLSVVKKDEKKIRLNQTQDEEQAVNWADDIADIIGVNVTWKK